MSFSVSAAFKNVGHFFASGAKHFVAFAKSAESILAKAGAEASTIEAVTRVVSPQAAEIEDIAFHVFGAFGQALEGADAAVSANGVNVQLDQEALAKAKAAFAALKAAPAAIKDAAAGK